MRYDCVYKGVRPGLPSRRSAPVVCVSRFFQRFVFVLSVAIFVTLGLGFALGQFGWFGVHAGDAQDGAYQQMRVYAEVLQKIQSDYVTDPNMNDVTAGALHGLLDSLDADSSYLSPAEYKVYKDRAPNGSAQEGITISKRFGYATIVNVEPESPADQSHLADGDVIESIDGKSTHDLSLAVIRMMLDGKAGSTVEVTVIRPNQPNPDKITLTRALVPTPPLEEQQYENSTILYLKPGELTAAHVDDMAAKIKAAPKSEKILLDLRDCTGNDPAQGLRLANFFIQQGTMATLEGQQYPEQTFTADQAKFLTGAPLAVIVNRGTYGGAELAAAAIGELKRGDVVGERTFGEGSVQKTLDLPDGGALILTVAKYAGPDGKKIQDDAVTPSVAVVSPQEDLEEGITPPNGDEMLNKALDLLKQKGA
jgi:carboxyl-terminal processing protease